MGRLDFATMACLIALTLAAPRVEAATIKFLSTTELSTDQLPDNKTEDVGSGLFARGQRFGFHKFDPRDRGINLWARSGAVVTRNPATWIRSLDALATERVKRTFILIPDPGDQGSERHVRVKALLTGTMFGGTSKGILGITSLLPGSYTASITGKVTIPSVLPTFQLSDSLSGNAPFIFGGETKIVIEQEEQIVRIPFNQQFELVTEVQTSVQKNGLAIITADVPSPRGFIVDLTIVDPTPPDCAVTRRGRTPDGKNFLEVTVRDTGSGLAAINTLVAENATVTIPDFTPGTTNPVVITSTRIDQSKPARVEFQLVDVEGNVRLCR